MKILEKKYRGSLICRSLGYPITYAIAKMLLDEGPMELDEITNRVRRNKSTVCRHLANLRTNHIVRYDKKNKKTIYWIKYPQELEQFFGICENLVKRITRKIEHDY